MLFSYCPQETVGLDGLPNLQLRELEDFIDFAGILVQMCFLSDNLTSEARFQVAAYEAFRKR